MLTGPPGWSHQMHQEHRCKFALTVQGLASAEADSGAWIDLTLPRHVGGVAPFCLHLLLLLPLGGGGFGGMCGGFPLDGGGGGDGGGLSSWKGVLDEGLWGWPFVSAVLISLLFSRSSILLCI